MRSPQFRIFGIRLLSGAVYSPRVLEDMLGRVVFVRRSALHGWKQVRD